MYNRSLWLYLIAVLLAAILVFLNYFGITGLVSRNQAEGLIVSLDIPLDQQKIKPGENILLEVVIRELGGTIEETFPIDLEYSIKDSEGNIISIKQERGSIAVKQSEVTSLLIPTSTKPGVYTASLSVNYKESTYIGTKTFEVISSQKKTSSIIYVILTVIIVIIILLTLLGKYYHRKKSRKRKKRR